MGYTLPHTLFRILKNSHSYSVFIVQEYSNGPLKDVWEKNTSRLRRVHPPPPTPLAISLIDLPSDMLLEIMKRVGQDSYLSFVNAKASCKTLKNVGEEINVMKHLSFEQVPFLVEHDNPFVRSVFVSALTAGNLKALFRFGIAHCLCAGGSYEHGCHLISNVARTNQHDAVYIFSLLMIAQSGGSASNFENLALEAWSKISDEEIIRRIRLKFDVWFPRLIERLMGGPVFRVKYYKSCGTHGPPNRSSQSCMRCRIDIELQWFVESLGGNYIVS